ncbi:Blue-light-activated protein (plasmid) [Sulfitobacter sp. DSM 110093]|uniref:PAS domain S-box protein n=1 Tax=Sulfitobacter sp. DSM 110093 TaxID=2883127 RepID=UPI00206E4E58|nr:PAS domain S-box protein [Sulfitobacter sp. DSM 110093]UOA33638.1 Blue-light-activated protein [Sulfitobacter sp. DSM 110093]
MKINDESPVLLALLDAAVDAMVVSDHAGNILRVNQAAAVLFGYSVDALVGQNVRMLMPDAMASRHDGFLRHHLETGEKRIIGMGRDVEGLRSDGRVFPLHLSVGRADISGEVAFVGIMHDLSRRKAAEEATARSQRMDAIGQMTGGIAHDFNNLLTVVIGNLELLEMAETSEKSGALISDALEAAEVGADLTSRLMVFARKSTLNAEVIDLNAEVFKAVAMLNRTIGAHIAVDTDFANDLWQAKIDATQLQTAVLNIALNAQDAMPSGGHIKLETRNMQLDDTYVAQEIGIDMGNYIRLSIADAGEGMSAGTRTRAMEPFFSTKPVGQGTGLGLSMVYGFIKQSGGHIAIYSEVGEGTTISLYFPALADAIQRNADLRHDREQHEQIGAGLRVLLVEDDPMVLRLSETRLKSLGFLCVTATSGDAAWEVLKARNDIDVVFTDLVMPGELSGHALARRVAKEMPHIRILITSGFSENVLRGKDTDGGFSILQKPYRQVDLAKAFRALFES